MRKLASIQKIKQIDPIPNADNIEVATVNGWEVVVKKGLYNEGDLVVYCEVDSFLPVRDEFEFLRKSSFRTLADGSEGFRLKSIKLRGQVSQGLIVPLDIIPDNVMEDLADYTSPFEHDDLIGTDVTDILEIKKWQRPIPASLAGEMKGDFPGFLKKTDEERIQNLTEEYDQLKKSMYFVTEKLEGSSTTFYIRDGEFGVCSRNLELLPSEKNTIWKVAREMGIEEKLSTIYTDSKFPFKNVAIQGEIIGEGIQGNHYNLLGQTIKFFNLFDIDRHKDVDPWTFQYVMRRLELPTVPVITRYVKLDKTIKELIDFADGKSLLNPEVMREGVVFRRLEGQEDDLIDSFKVISNEYLLNEK